MLENGACWWLMNVRLLKYSENHITLQEAENKAMLIIILWLLFLSKAVDIQIPY